MITSKKIFSEEASTKSSCEKVLAKIALRKIFGTEALANNRTEAGTRLREIRVRFWRGSNQVFFVFLTIYTLLFAQPVHAQSFRISPAILKLELSPGKTTTQQFLVENILETPLPVKLTVEGFDSSDEENGIKITDEVVTSPLTSWIKLDTEDTIIPPKSLKTITATITIPDTVTLGGYYAVIFFNPLLPSSEITETNSQITAKVGAIILANIGITSDQNEAEIITSELDKLFYNKQLPQLTLRTKNTGLNFFTAKPEITIDPLIGQTITQTLEEKTILPGKVRRWEKSLPLPNNYGLIYKVKVAISLENGQHVTAYKTILAFPITSFLLFGSTLLVLIYSLIHFKRLKKALTLLFKNED